MSTRTARAPRWRSGFMSAIRDAFREEDPAAHVHFHSGPAGRPAPCFDPRCDRPRLDAWAYEVECLMLPADEISVRRFD